MKFLVLVVVVAFVLWLMFGRKRPGVGRTPQPPQVEGMVSCAHCGVHLPRSEAVLDAGQAYCSEAHRLAGPSRR